MSLYQAVAVAVVTLAVVSDLRTRRIPNPLTFGAALAAIVVRSYVGGLPEAGWSLAGWVVGLACFFPFFALGGMGAGDVKLLGAVGAWLGPAAAVWVALFASIAGGVMALIVATYAGYLRKALENVWCLVMYWRVEGVRPAPQLTLSVNRGPRLAYAVPVLAGLVLTLWLR